MFVGNIKTFPNMKNKGLLNIENKTFLNLEKFFVVMFRCKNCLMSNCCKEKLFYFKRIYKDYLF